MRHAHDSQILINNNQFIGICLGSDQCAEHEWGIKDIRTAFGISSNNGYGLSRRIITKIPNTDLNNDYNTLLRCTKGKKHYLIFGSSFALRRYSDKNSFPELNIPNYIKPSDDIVYHMSCAWDDGSFGIATDNTLSHHLDELYQAFLNKDVSIFLGGGGPFKNAGLSICIASRLPKNVTDMWDEHDKDAEELKKTSQSIGIEEILKKAGKSWFALSPKWSKDIRSTVRGPINTSYPVVYWLNPTDQKNNNFGWYTVEDLMLWAVNNGPIPKNP